MAFPIEEDRHDDCIHPRERAREGVRVRQLIAAERHGQPGDVLGTPRGDDHPRRPPVIPERPSATGIPPGRCGFHLQPREQPPPGDPFEVGLSGIRLPDRERAETDDPRGVDGAGLQRVLERYRIGVSPDVRLQRGEGREVQSHGCGRRREREERESHLPERGFHLLAQALLDGVSAELLREGGVVVDVVVLVGGGR